MGASHTEAARQYQRENPGTSFPAAKRAVARNTAAARPVATRAPWVRSTSREVTVPCYFCGKDTILVSAGDLNIDPRRIQVYCDNDRCDARETEVIVVDDGTVTTSARTDVRILAQYGPVTYRPASSLIEEFGDWIPGATPAARRSSSICLFCGETTCGPSSADVSADTGRIRLHCNNARCDVIDVEVLVKRDGTPWTQERADICALDAIVPRPGGTVVGELTVYTARELRRVDPDEVLARRVSGSMP